MRRADEASRTGWTAHWPAGGPARCGADAAAVAAGSAARDARRARSAGRGGGGRPNAGVPVCVAPPTQPPALGLMGVTSGAPRRCSQGSGAAGRARPTGRRAAGCPASATRATQCRNHTRGTVVPSRRRGRAARKRRGSTDGGWGGGGRHGISGGGATAVDAAAPSRGRAAARRPPPPAGGSPSRREVRPRQTPTQVRSDAVRAPPPLLSDAGGPVACRGGTIGGGRADGSGARRRG